MKSNELPKVAVLLPVPSVKNILPLVPVSEVGFAKVILPVRVRLKLTFSFKSNTTVPVAFPKSLMSTDAPTSKFVCVLIFPFAAPVIVKPSVVDTVLSSALNLKCF